MSKNLGKISFRQQEIQKMVGRKIGISSKNETLIHGATKHDATVSSPSSFFRLFWQHQGTVVQGTWAWTANAAQTNYASVIGESAGEYYNSTNTDLDEYKWANIFLVKGVYKISLYVNVNTLWGIVEVLFGSVSLGTKDCYSAVELPNQLKEITFTLTEDTTADLRFRVNGKNASSTGYRANFSRFQLEKTG